MCADPRACPTDLPRHAANSSLCTVQGSFACRLNLRCVPPLQGNPICMMKTGTSNALAASLLAAGMVLLLAHPAAAQAAGGSGSLTTFLTNVANLITGTAGQC